MRYMRKASERARGRGPERVTSASDYHLLSLLLVIANFNW